MKRRLTIIFTVLIFCMAMLLQTIFFSIKYIGMMNTEKDGMSLISTHFQTADMPITEIINFFHPERKFLNRDGL